MEGLILAEPSFMDSDWSNRTMFDVPSRLTRMGLEEDFRPAYVIQLVTNVNVLLPAEAVLSQLICKPLFWD
jgi:hypothetical protein